MDEPTNDLDIATLTILENYLDTFQGIVITVSHDRYFLDRTMHRIFAFEENGRIAQYEGNYSDYILRKSMEQELSGSGQIISREKKSEETGNRHHAPKKLRFSYKEQKEYETIEADIAGLESQIEELATQIPQYARDFVKLQEVTEKKEQLEKELEEKMDRWMYLEDLAAKIAAGMTEDDL